MSEEHPAGKVVKTALIGIEIGLYSTTGLPIVRYGINGWPRLTFLDIVVDARGRHIPQRRTVGPDNGTELGVILKAYVELSRAWQGKLDAG